MEILDPNSLEAKANHKKEQKRLIVTHSSLIIGSSLLGFGISKAFKTNPLTTIAVALAVTYAGVFYHETHFTS